MRAICNLRMRLIGWGALATWVVGAILVGVEAAETFPISGEAAHATRELAFAVAGTLTITYLIAGAFKPMETAYLLGHEKGFQEGRSHKPPEVVRLCHERAMRRENSEQTTGTR